MRVELTATCGFFTYETDDVRNCLDYIQQASKRGEFIAVLPFDDKYDDGTSRQTVFVRASSVVAVREMEPWE